LKSVAYLARVLAIALVTLASGQVAADSRTTWGWFRASSTGSSWWLTSGEAFVTVEGHSFSADLRDDKDAGFTRVSLSGTITDRNVTARATVHATDMPDTDLSGRLRRLCWTSGGGREILVLTNGITVISIARELAAKEPCVPAA
jgi:hypothetical protein